jgi:hypothetical protein
MPNDTPWWRRPGVHLRHDAHRWIRHDAARFVRPGFDPADVFPTLARKAQPVQAPTLDDELAAEIEAERRVLDAINAELNEVNAEMVRWRALDAKYSPAQPRVPAGNPRGGQWTDRSGGQRTGQDIGQDAAQGDLASLTQPMSNVDIGDVSGSSEVSDLFNIRPADTRIDGVQLAGDFNQVGSDGKPVLDAEGNPYYSSGGHHEMPKGVYSKWNLSPETEKVFNQSTTGELPRGRVPIDDDGILRGHYWDGSKGAHQKYNDAVKELSDSFMSERNITPETMTPDQARDLLKAIRESDEPRIRDYNRMIRTLRGFFRFRGGRE